MKLSARNVVKGKVVELNQGVVNSVVKVDIGGGNVITSMITVGAVEDLRIAVGEVAAPGGKARHGWEAGQHATDHAPGIVQRWVASITLIMKSWRKDSGSREQILRDSGP